jgi:hypothetical protein
MPRSSSLDLDKYLVARRTRGNDETAGFGLSRHATARRGLDAVIDRVANYMDEWIAHQFDQLAVQLDIGPSITRFTALHSSALVSRTIRGSTENGASTFCIRVRARYRACPRRSATTARVLPRPLDRCRRRGARGPARFGPTPCPICCSSCDRADRRSVGRCG